VAITYLSRLHLPQWGAGSDALTRAQMNDALAEVNNKVAIDIQATTLGGLGSPGIQGRYGWVTSTGLLYRDDGTQWTALNAVMMGGVGLISASAPGDTASAGASGMHADASHRHAREGFGPSSSETQFGLAKNNGSAATIPRSDHTHGTPSLLAAGAAVTSRSSLNFRNGLTVTDDAPNDRTIVDVNAQPLTASFFIPNALSAGLRKPRWIAPVNVTVRLAYAAVDSGANAVFRIYADGASPTGMTDSPVVGTADTLHDFADFNLDAGHHLQVYVVSAGTGSDLSVTALAYPR